jgi:hypothetical protein
VLQRRARATRRQAGAQNGAECHSGAIVVLSLWKEKAPAAIGAMLAMSDSRASYRAPDI